MFVLLFARVCVSVRACVSVCNHIVVYMYQSVSVRACNCVSSYKG